MSLSNRERFRAITRFEIPGELDTRDTFWQETLILWAEKGAPPELTNSAFRGNYFGYNHRRGMPEIVSGLVNAPYMAGDIEAYLAMPPITPQYEPEVLKQDENTITILNQGGQTVKVFKNDPKKMPMFLDHPVVDRDTWKEYKKRLDPYTPERWPADGTGSLIR